MDSSLRSLRSLVQNDKSGNILSAAKDPWIFDHCH